jgi:hypothetical protein
VPSAKTRHDTLEPGLRFFLAHGRVPNENEDPEVPHGFSNGVFEAFMLWGRVLRVDVRAGVGDELEDLWRHHAVEICAAAGDEEPWVETFLRQHRSRK